MTTLDEVFLKLGQNENNNNHQEIDMQAIQRTYSENSNSVDPSSASSLQTSVRKIKIIKKTIFFVLRIELFFCKSIFGPSKFSIRTRFTRCIPIQIYAIFRLRYLLSIRNKSTLFYRLILPIPFIVCTILVPKLMTPSVKYDPNVNLFSIKTHKFSCGF
jgi:hypothetical protein